MPDVRRAAPTSYGTVLEHPSLRGLFYMVIGVHGELWLRAMVLRDSARTSIYNCPGDVVSIARDGWLVITEKGTL